MTDQSSSIRAAYRHCREITRDHAKTFFLASRFLRRDKRDACFAVYAICRHVDDLVDESTDPADAEDRARTRALIASFRRKLDNSEESSSDDRLIFDAWSDTVSRFPIDPTLPELLIEGCLTDLAPGVRIATFEELYDYCYKVASVVGLMTAPIFGYRDRAAEAHAVELGIAMQLTNIIRDVAEDYSRNRIYLPADEMKRFGVTEVDLSGTSASDPLRRLIRFQIRRARAYYASAENGIPMLDRDGRLAVSLMRHNYAAILDEIESRDCDVLAGRAWVPLIEKLKSLPVALAATVRSSA